MKKYSALCGLLLSITLAFTNVPAQTNAGITKNNPKTQTETKSAAKIVTTETIESDVAEALSIIEQNHVSGKNLDYNELFKTSIDSMLHTLDPHSNYFDAKEFEQFRTDQSSKYFGIGATIGDLSDANGNVIATYIKATFDGAPAEWTAPPPGRAARR